MQPRNKRISNIIAGVIFATLAIAIICTKVVEHLGERKQVQHTMEALTEVGEGFAENNRAVMQKWAKGDYRDAWDAQIVIDGSNHQGISFASKGPDGLLGTDDDIHSLIYEIEHQPIYAAKVNDAIVVGKEKIVEVKQQVEDREIEVGKWKFRWKWGEPDPADSVLKEE